MTFNEYTTFAQVDDYFPESKVRNNVNFAIGKQPSNPSKMATSECSKHDIMPVYDVDK